MVSLKSRNLRHPVHVAGDYGSPDRERVGGDAGHLRLLLAQVVELRAEVAALKAELARLKKTSENSSLPPSTQHPHARPVKPKQASRKNRGGQPGHPKAERALRQAVIWRKLSFGTQSADGSRFVETLLSIIETCRRQQRNVFDRVARSVQVHIAGQPTPSLLPGV